MTVHFIFIFSVIVIIVRLNCLRCAFSYNDISTTPLVGSISKSDYCMESINILDCYAVISIWKLSKYTMPRSNPKKDIASYPPCAMLPSVLNWTVITFPWDFIAGGALSVWFPQYLAISWLRFVETPSNAEIWSKTQPLLPSKSNLLNLIHKEIILWWNYKVCLDFITKKKLIISV